MKIALGQINPTIGDFAGNTRLILDAAGRAAEQQASLVLFPELAVCGYPPADLLEKDDFVVAAGEALDRIAAWTANPDVLLSSAEPVMFAEGTCGKRVRNVAALLSRGVVQFVQQKMLLPFYDVFDEQRYFEPAARQSLVQVDGQTIAITICEDAWNDKAFWPERRYRTDPVEELMSLWPGEEAVRIMVNLSASPFWCGKQAVREQMLGAVARRDRAWVAMVNQVGGTIVSSSTGRPSLSIPRAGLSRGRPRFQKTSSSSTRTLPLP